MALVRVRNRFTKEQKQLEKSVAILLKDKFEIIGEEQVEAKPKIVERVIEPAKVEESPNPAAAEKKEIAAVSETEVSTDELTLAREEYKKLFGEAPHGRLKLESIKKLITEKNG